MGRFIAILVAIVLALVFLPGLVSGGSDGAKDAGRSAGDTAVDTVKDPDKVIDAAGKVTTPVVEVAVPWWKKLYAQPWFWTFAIAGFGAYLGRKWWMNMGGSARLITVGVGVALLFFVFIAIGGK